jgi:hypothetical protein
MTMLIRTIDQGPRLLVLMLLVPPVKLFVTGSLCATGELGINVVLNMNIHNMHYIESILEDMQLVVWHTHNA